MSQQSQRERISCLLAFVAEKSPNFQTRNPAVVSDTTVFFLISPDTGGETEVSCQELFICDNVTSLHFCLTCLDMSAEPDVSIWPPTEACMLNKPFSH